MKEREFNGKVSSALIGNNTPNMQKPSSALAVKFSPICWPSRVFGLFLKKSSSIPCNNMCLLLLMWEYYRLKEFAITLHFQFQYQSFRNKGNWKPRLLWHQLLVKDLPARALLGQ
jgi:hypothetical protein